MNWLMRVKRRKLKTYVRYDISIAPKFGSDPVVHVVRIACGANGYFYRIDYGAWSVHPGWATEEQALTTALDWCIRDFNTAMYEQQKGETA